MNGSPTASKHDAARRTVAARALENARVEVVRRLLAKSLPTSVTASRMVIIDDPEGNGWSGHSEAVARSSLSSDQVAIAVGGFRSLDSRGGLSEPLGELVELLEQTTDLGRPQEQGFMPAGGPGAIMIRYVQPFALHYLQSLGDVAIPQPELRDRLLDELDELCNRADRISQVSQLPLSGIRLDSPLGPYRDVVLRPLDGVERGAIASEQPMWMSRDAQLTGGFVVPKPFTHFEPLCLLEVRTERGRDATPAAPELPQRLALALLLAGFDIGSSGAFLVADVPRWASIGASAAPLPVDENPFGEDRLIDRAAFEAAVDLAYAMPALGSGEGNAREVALHRALRGLGTRDSGFLDLAIALEASLLDGAHTELAYRFSLYGSLFLREERDPASTFAQLRDIYKIRSGLVHGGKVDPARRGAAETAAVELTRAVVRRALEVGWPNATTLDRLALADD